MQLTKHPNACCCMKGVRLLSRQGTFHGFFLLVPADAALYDTALRALPSNSLQALLIAQLVPNTVLTLISQLQNKSLINRTQNPHYKEENSRMSRFGLRKCVMSSCIN